MLVGFIRNKKKKKLSEGNLTKKFSLKKTIISFEKKLIIIFIIYFFLTIYLLSIK